MSKKFMYLCTILLFAAGYTVLIGCSDSNNEVVAPVYITNLSEGERNLSAFKEQFPYQYETYQKTREDGLETKTKYKASFAFHKNDNTNEPPVGFPGAAQPYLKNLWLGYPFSFEYNEARGHAHAVQDILDIDRINRYDENAGLPGTCWNCKTTKVLDWQKEYGDLFWSMNFNEFRDEMHISPMENSISCDTCHNPTDMTLRISSIPLNDALLARGVDWREASRNEMRAYVCAQCHVEYYFTDPAHGPAAKPVFPWTNTKDGGDGREPEQIYEYYQDKGPMGDDGMYMSFMDWQHPVSQTRMLKAQHPEFETWYNGPHGAAGVTCADCHMPYVRLDGKKKISSHQWISPLRSEETINGSCRQCHSDKSAEYLRERVEFTQDKVYTMLLEAQAVSVRAHEAVRQAAEWGGKKNPQYTELLAEAREHVRKGQFFWDLVSAENSIGFHNPSKAFDTLNKSKNESNAAVARALEATQFGIASVATDTIEEIVPPILDWSREMQMDQENLDKHIWTKYLPLLPKAEKVWDGQQKIATQ